MVINVFTNVAFVLLQAKVMRYLNEVADDGKARSRGYGFVTFKKHEHALTVLRALNNNPDVFTPLRVSISVISYLICISGKVRITVRSEIPSTIVSYFINASVV